MNMNVNEQRIEYIREWLNNPENELNCTECPENREQSSWGGCLPCGQQHCWVSCHIRKIDE